MASVTTSQRQGVNASMAVKVPCRVASTSNITLSGEQTIDGVAVVTDDRVLVTGQTDASENGIYTCDTGAWSRAKDWNGTYDIVKGTTVRAHSGTSNSGYWIVTTADPITIGTTNVAFTSSGTLGDFSDTTSTANGDAIIGVKRTEANAEATTQHVVNQVRKIYLGADYGASLSRTNGTDDWTTVIQNAINDVKDSVETVTADFTQTYEIIIPANTICGISSDLLMYSGVKLIGEGPSSRLKELGTFVGTNLITLSGTNFCNYFKIENLLIETATVPAIGQNVGVVGNAEIRDVVLDAVDGIILDSYAQEMIIERIFSYGAIDRIIELRGNHNIIRDVDKEGLTGSSAAPYIYIYDHASSDSNGNVLDRILIEGTTSVNKSAIKLLNCNHTILRSIWHEPSTSDGYGIRIDTCRYTKIESVPPGFSSSLTKLKIDSSRLVTIDFLNTEGTDESFHNFVEVDATSTLVIDNLQSRRNDDTFKLSPNIIINNAYNRQKYVDALTGYEPISKPIWLAGQNFVSNPSFEAGNYGWTWTTGPTTTEEYITSEVSNGLMLHGIWSVATTDRIYQTVTVPANMPITITALVEMVSGTGTIQPYANGLGITNANGYDRTNAGEGWQLITRTVVPTSAGSLTVGVNFLNVTEVNVDSVSVSVGMVGVPDMGNFNTLQLGGKTITYGSAAPTGGTWKAGDIVFDSSPTAGSRSMGWVCTAAGSPGTWKTWGDITA